MYPQLGTEGEKKSGTRRRLIPTIHPSTYREGMPTDRQLLSTRYPSKTYIYPCCCTYRSAPAPPRRLESSANHEQMEERHIGGKQEPFWGSSRFSIVLKRARWRGSFTPFRRVHDHWKSCYFRSNVIVISLNYILMLNEKKRIFFRSFRLIFRKKR